MNKLTKKVFYFLTIFMLMFNIGVMNNHVCAASNYERTVSVGESTSIDLSFSSDINIAVDSSDSSIAYGVVTGTSVNNVNGNVSYGKTVTIYGTKAGEATLSVINGEATLTTISVTVEPVIEKFEGHVNSVHKICITSSYDEEFRCEDASGQDVEGVVFSVVEKTKRTSTVTINQSSYTQVTYQYSFAFSFDEAGDYNLLISGDSTGLVYNLQADISAHDWNEEYTIDKEATCTEKGTESIHCSICDSIKKGTKKEIAATGHSYKKTALKAATTAANGKISYTCANCGHVKATTITKIKSISLSTTTYTYNGSVKTPNVTVKDTNGTLLKKNTDYKVTYAAGRKNAGSYKVTVTLKGNYSGKVVKTFKINKAAQTITASKKTLTVGGSSVAIGAKRTVGNGSLTYSSSNKKIVTVSSSGKITPKAAGKATITITAKETANYKKAVKKITVVVNPKKTDITSVKSSKNGQITVKWTQKSDISGYQIRYSKNSDMSNSAVKTITSKSTFSKTITGLSKGAKYYVQIRTYKTVSETKYYSSWSNKKSVTTLNKSSGSSNTYVWLSATGTKYHSIPNCGNMNPNKARRVTKSSAISSGYKACKNCH